MQLFGTKEQRLVHCPGTKGQWDKEIFLSRDKGPTGVHLFPDCPGTSRLLEILVYITTSERSWLDCAIEIHWYSVLCGVNSIVNGGRTVKSR